MGAWLIVIGLGLLTFAWLWDEYDESKARAEAATAPETPETCATCRYRVQQDCRFESPVLVEWRDGNHAGARTEWPQVRLTDWCGEHTPHGPTTTQD